MPLTSMQKPFGSVLETTTIVKLRGVAPPEDSEVTFGESEKEGNDG